MLAVAAQIRSFQSLQGILLHGCMYCNLNDYFPIDGHLGFFFPITILQISLCVDVLMSISIACIFSNGTIGQRICIFKIWLIQLSFPPQSLLLFIFPPMYENVYFFTLDKTLDIFRLYISVWCWHRDYQITQNTDHTFIQWWSVTLLTL